MDSRNATQGVAGRPVPPAEPPPPVRARCCQCCNNFATCAIARYTNGEVEICSRWEERNTAA